MATSKSRKLARRVVIRIFNPGNASSQTRIILAGADKHFTEAGIQSLLESTAEEIERLLPGHEYSLVELKQPAHFNFVCLGEKNLLNDDQGAPRRASRVDGAASPSLVAAHA